MLVGGKRALALFAYLKKPSKVIDADLPGLMAFLEELKGKTKIALLLSGDPGFYSLLPMIVKEIGAEGLRVIPGLSSLQLAFARIKLPWQDCRWQSLHGRPLEKASLWLEHDGWIAYVTDPKNSPEKICQYLQQKGEGWRQAIILKNLAYEDEIVIKSSIEALAEVDEKPYQPALLLVKGGKKEEILSSQDKSQVPFDEEERFYPGLPDQTFLRQQIPMTKSDIRALTLLRAAIQKHDRIWDVGSGTGSISMEAAQLAPLGHVYAIERKSEACTLIKANCRHFDLSNVTVLETEAPTGLDRLPQPNVIIIGGSGGQLQSLLSTCWQRLQPKGRIVLNAITVETLAEATAWFEKAKIPFQAVQVQVQKMEKAGSYHLWKSQNPVTIFWASKEDRPCHWANCTESV
ncbi:precorrin-6y C5,15-methyltransferase (decarboxylating), CbiE subunit [Heliorestis convoluta]|uniref:Precorrin-6y C5,15-methyltransferase (Decarboxylating), CbiE subunit n=2 Tax=Heliorestis convoluta TaxID=356322 RepID=A0A5Q2MWL0_9FIRM|nr:precorrin-6y C5,15-methyltransferase (decarboxylating), CbiE subunit [Heliorestis convoluta]